ncbi:hypothetical protein PIB30_088376 [Stylosanthes scabra]|uniref:Uncharacterized protein n=1 Tax=Stylosanthes scabra TaxID=79078 RepID=A0ABU6SV23_9FABA|nr:hypothetical protein [Stylosanthes scabra]
MLIIYFHETQFGKNSRDPKAQPPWITYWIGNTLWDRMKQKKCNVVVSKSDSRLICKSALLLMSKSGLVKTGKMRAEKERLQKKNPKNTASSESEWESKSETESEESNSEESYKDSDSEETRSEELVQTNRRPKPNLAQEEKRSKKKG